jgi:1,4-dihydroxy-2-naphthoate octaprenyltransferase
MQPAEVARPRWWQALDPPIYLVSVLPGAAAWLLVTATGPVAARLTLATLAVVLLQHAINVLNDVSDWRLGADSEKYTSWARFHHLDLRAATAHGYASLLAGGLLGLVVLVEARQLHILLFAAPLVLLGYLYNSGPRPLAYTHLGEWVTGLCYGGVFGCLWLLAEGRPAGVLIPGSVAFCTLAVALLLSHQPPQIDTDRQAGKRSFAVRFGARRTRQAARGLFAVFLLAFALALWQANAGRTALLACGITALPGLLFVLRTEPAPKRILGSATLVILATLLVGRITPAVVAGG